MSMEKQSLSDSTRAFGESRVDDAVKVCGTDAEDCGCCGMSGRGGKLRIGLLIVVFVVVVVLLVHGFATAG